jgi:hypothetical protein
MPPKTKKEKQQAEKRTEDKTFGMKNKNKSAKVQKYIQQVNSSAKHIADMNKSVSRKAIKRESPF